MATKKSLIKEYCNRMNGKYIEGTMGHGPMMVLQHENFEIVFDYHVVSTGKSSVTYTRVRAAFKDLKGFNMKIRKEGFFTKIGKAFGGQDIEIGDAIFDEQYVIKSNDSSLVSSLLHDFDIKSRINFNKGFYFDIVKKNSMGVKCVEGESALYFAMLGKLKHEVEVINLIELFQITLDRLLALNITNEEPTKTVMYKEKKSKDDSHIPKTFNDEEGDDYELEDQDDYEVDDMEDEDY